MVGALVTTGAVVTGAKVTGAVVTGAVVAGAEVYPRLEQSVRWSDWVVDQTLQKRQTLSMQPTPPAAHAASAAIWIPTAASPGLTVRLHVGAGALVTTGATVTASVATGVDVVVTSVAVVVAGTEVVDDMLEQSVRCADCVVVSTLQKRHTSLMQPTPPRRHVASVTTRIPTAASPADTDTAQVEMVVPLDDPSSNVSPKTLLPDPDDGRGGAGNEVVATGVAVVATGVAVVATGVAVVVTGATVVDGMAVVEL